VVQNLASTKVFQIDYFHLKKSKPFITMSCQHGEETFCNQYCLEEETKDGVPAKTTTIKITKDGVPAKTTTTTEDGAPEKTTTAITRTKDEPKEPKFSDFYRPSLQQKNYELLLVGGGALALGFAVSRLF